jgi:Sigma-70, region 4/Bacterial RNA polymerase, alpha chain C terminal domain
MRKILTDLGYPDKDFIFDSLKLYIFTKYPYHRHVRILFLRYDLAGDGTCIMTLQDIGDLVGVSKERVRQVKVQALEYIKSCFDYNSPQCELTSYTENRKLLKDLVEKMAHHKGVKTIPSGIKLTPIEYLKLIPQPYNCLIKVGVDTIEELELLYEIELKNIERMGNMGIRDIYAKYLKFTGKKLILKKSCLSSEITSKSV